VMAAMNSSGVKILRIRRHLLSPDPSGRGWWPAVFGILFSMLVMIIETGYLLSYYPAAPQGGFPVFQTPGAGPSSWVSAFGMVSLMALTLSTFTEQIVLILSLRLLFRTKQAFAEVPQGPEK
jgi:hypothetical protein